MPVPYLFSKVPGGTTIPLAELDANFAYLTGSPSFTNLSLSGNLSVGGSSTFSGPVTTNDLAINGALTIDGMTVNPTGITGTGLLVLNTGPTLVAPALGTPVSGNLTNCTGYPITQIAGLATGVLPFLTNPTTANLAAAVVDETGTGNLVLSNNPTLTSPTFVAPALGTPVSGNLSFCTNFPAANLSGIVPIAKGGTGLSAAGAVGQLLGVVAANTLGYLSAPPSSDLAGGAASQLVYQAAPNTTAFVPNGTAGQALISNGSSVPSWGSLNIAAYATGILPIANGGTGNTTMGAGVQSALTTPVNTTGGFVTYPVPDSTPPSAVMYFARPTPPTGWLVANGAAVSRSTYAALFAAIGTTFGSGDGSTTFNLPNINGQFVRGWDSTGTVDPGRTFGSNQSQSFASHTHAATVVDPGHKHDIEANGGANVVAGGNYFASDKSPVPISTLVLPAFTGITVTNSATGGSETRPVNVALLACIKY